MQPFQAHCFGVVEIHSFTHTLTYQWQRNLPRRVLASGAIWGSVSRLRTLLRVLMSGDGSHTANPVISGRTRSTSRATAAPETTYKQTVEAIYCISFETG